jgi:hypothetical protein
MTMVVKKMPTLAMLFSPSTRDASLFVHWEEWHTARRPTNGSCDRIGRGVWYFAKFAALRVCSASILV